MLASRITTPNPTDPEIEDIFSSSLATLFTDDTQQSHGVPGQSVIYHSPRFGDVVLHIPAHPDEESGRTLFAHYLWNAGVVVAEGVERASCRGERNGDVDYGDGSGNDGDDGEDGGGWEGTWKNVEWERQYWNVRGRDVLELGAGTALPSLISTLSSASSVTITDHPSSPALTTNAIATNVKLNITERCGRNATDSTTAVRIAGYAWGTQDFQFHPVSASKLGHDISSPSTSTSASIPPPSQPELRSFDKIIIADCLWMASQHENLVKTIVDYLKPINSHPSPSTPESEQAIIQTPSTPVPTDGQAPETESTPCAIILAGFHTGRKIVADFIELATGSAFGSDHNDNEDNHDHNKKHDDAESRTRSDNLDEFNNSHHIDSSNVGNVSSNNNPPETSSPQFTTTTTTTTRTQENKFNQNQDQKETPDNDNNDDDKENDEKRKGRLKSLSLHEINIHGHIRPWAPSRSNEDKEERKKWIVCCILVRK